MRSWRNVKLGEVAEFINGDRGNNYPSQGDFVEGGVPFINAGHLKNGKIDFSDMNYIKESRFNLLGNGKTRLNDILYCLRGSLGKTAIVHYDGSAAIASSLVIIRPSRSSYSGYLYHFLTSPIGQAEIRKFDNGSSQPNLSANSVKNYLIPVPPLAEQRRIAEILDRGEALRAKRRASLAQLDTVSQSIFTELMMSAQNRMVLKTVEDSLEVIIDYRGRSPTKTSSGVPLITARVVKGGELLEPNEFIAEKDYDAWMRRGLPTIGDVLFTTEAPLGEVAQLDGRKVALAQRLLVLRGKRELLDNTFLKHVLTAPEVRKQIRARSTGSTVRGIRQRELRQVMLPIPPISLQRKFAHRMLGIEKLKTGLQASLAELNALFASLQHRAFRGEL